MDLTTNQAYCEVEYVEMVTSWTMCRVLFNLDEIDLRLN